jgi:hypothetical protein
MQIKRCDHESLPSHTSHTYLQAQNVSAVNSNRWSQPVSGLTAPRKASILRGYRSPTAIPTKRASRGSKALAITPGQFSGTGASGSNLPVIENSSLRAHSSSCSNGSSGRRPAAHLCTHPSGRKSFTAPSVEYSVFQRHLPDSYLPSDRA